MAISGTSAFAFLVVPLLDLVIYKMGGNNGQYDPAFTNIPQPEPSHARDDWKPIAGTPFMEGSRAGDDGIRRVLEMVCAAVKEWVPLDTVAKEGACDDGARASRPPGGQDGRAPTPAGKNSATVSSCARRD